MRLPSGDQAGASRSPRAKREPGTDAACQVVEPGIGCYTISGTSVHTHISLQGEKVVHPAVVIRPHEPATTEWASLERPHPVALPRCQLRQISGSS
jgi:hypothetical protein